MPEIPIRSFAVSLVAVRRQENQHHVLLLRRTRSLAGEWCQIAGAVEDGESAWQAAVRELAEETALSPLALYSADICEQFYETDRNAICIVPVFVAYVDVVKKVVLNDEHSEFCWVSFDGATKMVPFVGQRRVLQHVKREFADREPCPHLKIELS